MSVFSIYRNLLKFIDNLSLKTKLMFLFALFSGIPVIGVGLLSYHRSSAIIDAQAAVYSESIVNQIRRRVDEIRDDIKKISISLVINPNIQRNHLMMLDGIDLIKNKNLIKTILTTSKFMKGSISSIYLCYEDGTIVSTEAVNIEDELRYREFLAYTEAIKASTKPVWIGVHENEFSADKQRIVFSYVRTVYDAETFQYLGVMIFNLPASVLDEICGNDYNVAIMDRKGQIVYTNKSFNVKLIEEGMVFDEISRNPGGKGSFLLKNGDKWSRMQYATSEKNDWIFLAEVPVSFLQQNSRETRKYISFILVLVLSLSVAAAVLTSSYFIRPLISIIGTMKKVQEGDFDVCLNIDNRSETGQLAYHYIMMLKRINQLVEDIKKTSLQKRQAEITALQAQITPHFLYNTLNSIKCMARVQKNTGIEEAIDSLIELLRLSISYKTEFITLAEELEIIKKYVFIQNFRYGNRIQLFIDCQEDVLQLMILKMTLQPLVENSILHGLPNKKGPGIINIRAYRIEKGLCVEVEDNGVGMTEETIQRVRSGALRSDRRFNGIGINNIQERIVLYFGNDYGISYKSVPGEYTCAVVNLPAISEKEVEQYV